MRTPVEIHFHGIEKSAAIEERVREKMSKIDKHFGRMTRCRVVLEAPHRSPQKPKVYQIKIEISLPRRKPIVVRHERSGAHANEELPLAIRDAFEAALRRIDDIGGQLTRTKLERGRRRPPADGRDLPRPPARPAPSMGGPAEHGGGNEPCGDGQRYRHEAVERRRAECKTMEVSLEPFALEVEADRVLTEQFLIVEEIDPRIEWADRHVGRQLDGGPKQALADEGDAKVVLDVEPLLLLEPDDGLLELFEVFGGQR